MNKLNMSDVQILSEGAQIRNVILKDYTDIKEFHEKFKIPMALSTFRSYFSHDGITASSFKYAITMALDKDYTSLFVPKKKQIKDHVQNIYDNIEQYKEEDDQQIFEYLLCQCEKEDMPVQEAMMYRAKARNYYITNRINLCQEYYEFAVDALPKDEISKKAFFYCELSYDLSRENLLEKAEKKFRYAEELIKWHDQKQKIDNNTLHYYHYWRGILLMDTGKNAEARDYFRDAFKYASKNFEKASAVSNIGLSYCRKKSYAEGLKYFEEALKHYDESNILTTASIYNNIAVAYRLMGDYTNASDYARKSLDILKVKYNVNKHLLYTESYVEILMEMGDSQAYTLYFDALISTKGKHMHKSVIIDNTRDFIININDLDCLKKLVDIIIDIKDASTSEGFTNGMYECLGYIAEKLIKLGKGRLSEQLK